MSLLNEHNQQHTYGNSLGPPGSVVGVSAQQAIDANKRLVEAGGRKSSSSSDLKWRDGLRLAIGFLAFSFISAAPACVIGGIGAVACGLLSVVAGFLGVVFLVISLIAAIKS